MKPRPKAKDWESPDVRFGRNLRALRERKGLSQKTVAEAMAGRGHTSWYQNTLTRVESGVQPLKLSEADDLRDILETSIDRLTWASQEAEATELLYGAGAAVRNSYETVATAVRDHLHVIHDAERWAEHYKDNPAERVREARDDALGRVEEYDLDGAVDEGVRRWDERAEQAR